MRKKKWYRKIFSEGTSLILGCLLGCVLVVYVATPDKAIDVVGKAGTAVIRTFNALQQTYAILNNKRYTLPSPKSKDITDISPGVFQRMHDSVVRIWFVPNGGDCQNGRRARGTGTVVYSNDHMSYILTNNHIGGNSTVCGSEVESPQYMGLIPGKTVATSGKADLAIIQVDRPMLTSPIATEPLKIHQPIVVIGNPMGRPWFTEVGFKTKESLMILGSWAEQLACMTYPGNSGSPVYNMNGEVNGVIYAGIYGMWNIGFNIPLSSVTEFLEEIKFPAIRNNVKIEPYKNGYSTKPKVIGEEYIPID